MTTSPVMTVTDELLAELEEAASNATQDAWELLPGTNLSGPEIIANGESIAWVLDSEADAVHVATANPATIAALIAELRRLRAENAELAQSLAESRANDQAAMGWLTSLRWASGDRGERMLPELVAHIEGMAKDAGRLDLLDSLCESYGFQDVHEGNRWVIDGPFRDIRTAADSLEAQ